MRDGQTLSKRLLQVAVSVGGLVPVGAGLAGASFGPSLVGGMSTWPISLDSHFDYLSGLLLGIGICFGSTIKNIEQKRVPFRMLTLIVMVGGLARLNSLICDGLPDRAMLFGLAMELIVTPCLAFWQYRVAKTYGITE